MQKEQGKRRKGRERPGKMRRRRIKRSRCRRVRSNKRCIMESPERRTKRKIRGWKISEKIRRYRRKKENI